MNFFRIFFLMLIFSIVLSCDNSDTSNEQLLPLLNSLVINPEAPNTVTFKLDNGDLMQWPLISYSNIVRPQFYFDGPGMSSSLVCDLPDGSVGAYDNDDEYLEFEYMSSLSNSYIYRYTNDFSVTVIRWDGPGGECIAEFSGYLSKSTNSEKLIYIEGNFRANIQ